MGSGQSVTLKNDMFTCRIQHTDASSSPQLSDSSARYQVEVQSYTIMIYHATPPRAAIDVPLDPAAALHQRHHLPACAGIDSGTTPLSFAQPPRLPPPVVVSFIEKGSLQHLPFFMMCGSHFTQLTPQRSGPGATRPTPSPRTKRASRPGAQSLPILHDTQVKNANEHLKS